MYRTRRDSGKKRTCGRRGGVMHIIRWFKAQNGIQKARPSGLEIGHLEFEKWHKSL